jgi:hypothetical protein
MSRSSKLEALSPSGPPSLGTLDRTQSTTKSLAHLRGHSDHGSTRSTGLEGSALHAARLHTVYLHIVSKFLNNQSNPVSLAQLGERQTEVISH